MGRFPGLPLAALVSLLSMAVPLTMQASALQIHPKPCHNSLGDLGTCMFVWDCIKTEGKHLGTCVDGFLFGSCCAHNDHTNVVPGAGTLASITDKRTTLAPLTGQWNVPTNQSSITQSFRPTGIGSPVAVTSSTLLVNRPTSYSSHSGSVTFIQKPSLPMTSQNFPPENFVTNFGSGSSGSSLSSQHFSSIPTRTPAYPSRTPSVSTTERPQPPRTTTRRPTTYSKPSTWRPVSSFYSTTITAKPPIFTKEPVRTTTTRTTFGPPAETQSQPAYISPGTIYRPGSTTLSVASPFTWYPHTGSGPTGKPFSTSPATTKKPLPIISISVVSSQSTQTATRPPVHFKPTSPSFPTWKPILITAPFSTKTSPLPTEATESVTEANNESTEESTTAAAKSCGLPSVHPQMKVVGGKNSAFGAWPWQASVRRTSFFGFSSTHRCGGALISKQWIATAGHCVDDLLLSQIKVRVGEYDFASVQEPFGYVERGVKRKVVHPRYNFFTYENDLALVQLEEALEVENLPHISPICLPPSEEDLVGKNATVTGWGRLSEGGVLPSILQEVQVPIISNEKCKNMFLAAGRHEYIPDIFMCAGFEEGGRDSCQGDSGGPLQIQGDDGHWFLAGIISWGIGCAEPNMPGVCTRISKFKDWVLQNIR